MTVYKKSLVLH